MKKSEGTTNWYSSFAHSFDFDFDRMTFGFDSDKCDEKRTQNKMKTQRNRKQARVNVSNEISLISIWFSYGIFTANVYTVWSIHWMYSHSGCTEKWSSMLTRHHQWCTLQNSFFFPFSMCACKMNEDYIIAIASTHSFHSLRSVRYNSI